MAAPVGRHVGEWLEPVRNAVVDLLLVRIRLSIALADTLGDNSRITLGVASVLAVLALHASRVLEELPTERTTHDVVELVLDELVAVHFVHLFLSLADGTLSSKT
jgi:phosphatidylglycerophosphatase A